MNYFAVDVGGSSIKYAVMTEEMHFLKKGKAESRHLETPEQFIAEIKKLYEENGCCEGGIAVSFCGETNEKTGYLYSGGSYPYLAKLNLKDMIEEACNTKASVENDGCCAGLAESRYGTLRGYQNAAVVVIGTGLGGAIILNGALYHGAHGYAGSASLLARNIEVPYTKQSWSFRVTGASYPGNRYAQIKGLEPGSVDGIMFFKACEEKDPDALKVLEEYASALANTLFNIHLILDVEAIAIGGGISQQPLLKEYVQKAFDAIYETPGMPKIGVPKPMIRICEFHNDANLIGALSHHLNMINTEESEKGN